jgi:hypothetical protein
MTSALLNIAPNVLIPYMYFQIYLQTDRQVGVRRYEGQVQMYCPQFEYRSKLKCIAPRLTWSGTQIGGNTFGPDLRSRISSSLSFTANSHAAYGLTVPKDVLAYPQRKIFQFPRPPTVEYVPDSHSMPDIQIFFSLLMKYDSLLRLI